MKNDNDPSSDRDGERSNDGRYPTGTDIGALLVEPAPPKRGSFTLLLPENFTWGAKRRNGAIRIDFREITKTPRSGEGDDTHGGG